MIPSRTAIEFNTVILLFTRTPRQEAAHKDLVPGARDKNLTLARQLLRHAQRVARQSGLPLHTAYRSQQRGRQFGERLANAVARCFAHGYDKLVIIGNDCPQLQAATLRAAARDCQAHRAVLGPARDGGLYLIALHRHHFDAAAFAALDWESPRLGANFQDYLQARDVASRQLATYRDIDDAEALHRLLTELSECHPLYLLLQDLATPLAPSPPPARAIPLRDWGWTAIPGRAPPFLRPL
ncbi:MAG: DUF2064 domain-containing protein [Bacteroidota bacterium]